MVADVFAFDSNNIYRCGVSGTDDVVSKTSNGGKYWTPMNSGITYNKNSVYFTTPNEGWVVGKYSYHTSDANYLYEFNPGFNAWKYCIHFANENEGWVVGDSGRISNTVDKGATWKLQNSGTQNTLLSVFCVDANNGWIVGAGGLILKRSTI